MKRILSSKIFKLSLSLFLVFSIGLVAFSTSAMAAKEKEEAQQILEKSKLTFESFMKDPHMGTMQEMLKIAKGVFISPQLLRGAFIVGVSGGSGIYINKTKDGEWSGPAFYTLGGASIGLQVGGDASEVIILIMSDKGTRAFESSNIKLGLDVGIAVGPVGRGLSAQTANLSADILSFSRAKGLYGGVSLKGAVVKARNGLNTYFYDKPLNPAQILRSPASANVSNMQLNELLEEIAKAARR
jgi:lipid-binding SYLF domain-containing protein